MFAHGTTTAEAKTGYGLQTSTELLLLKALLALDDESPLDLVTTFLGAHAIPPEFKDNPQGYTDEVTNTMLPMLKEWWGTHVPRLPLPFVDVFCETNAFSLEQSRQILTQAGSLGFPLKIHADEFDNLGGAALAAELGAASADHLVVTSDADIAALGKSDQSQSRFHARHLVSLNDYTPAKNLEARLACPRHRLQPGHLMERVDAVCDCAGMPLHEVDACASHRRLHYQFRPRNSQVRYDRLHRSGKAGGYAHPVRVRLSSGWLSLWNEFGEASHQAGGYVDVGYYRTA